VGMWTSCPGHSTAGAVVLRQRQDAIADSPPPPLTAAAAESHQTPQTLSFFFSIATGTSAAADTRSICPVPFPSRLITTLTSTTAAVANK